MINLAVVDDFYDAEIVRNTIEHAPAFQWVSVDKVTAALVGDSEPVERHYGVLDGEWLNSGVNVSLYQLAYETVRATLDARAIESPFARSAMCLKRYAAPDGLQGWHFDTNPISAVLYLTSCQGGQTELRGLGSVEPRPNRLVMFRGGAIEHRAARVTAGEKLVAVMNFYLPGDCTRPFEADEAMFQ